MIIRSFGFHKRLVSHCDHMVTSIGLKLMKMLVNCSRLIVIYDSYKYHTNPMEQQIKA